MSAKLSRASLKNLTPEERKEHDRQMNNARMRRHRKANKNTQEYKASNKNYTHINTGQNKGKDT